MSSFHAYVFDMDGTLTQASHDFAQFKRDHGLDANRGILETANLMTQPDRAKLMASVEAWEWEHARKALPTLGAYDWLATIHRQARPMSILTRNTKPIALATLKAAGLAEFFPEHLVFGRHQATAKPSPQGIIRLLELMGHTADGAVMVGNHADDITAGRRAGTYTISVGPTPVGDHHAHYDRVALIPQ